MCPVLVFIKFEVQKLWTKQVKSTGFTTGRRRDHLFAFTLDLTACYLSKHRYMTFLSSTKSLFLEISEWYVHSEGKGKRELETQITAVADTDELADGTYKTVSTRLHFSLE